MNRDDIRKMLTVIKAAYPSTFAKMDLDTARKMVELYSAMFRDEPSDVAMKAVEMYIKENEFCPTVAGIKKYIEMIKGESDYEQMFDELWKGICGNRKFEELCPENQRYIQSQKALHDLGQSENTIKSVVKGQYMKRIAEITEQMKVEADAVKTLGETRMREIRSSDGYKRLTSETTEAGLGEVGKTN